MFEIIFLGTSASAPSVHRGLSAQIISHNEYRFLVDCGEGTQRQILQSGIGFRRLSRILITHGHLDHILGLAGLLSTFLRWETIDELEIMAGRGALERIHDLLYGVVLRKNRPDMDLRLTEIKPGIVFQDDDFYINAFPVIHRGPDCLGYVFAEKSKRPFLADKAEALKIPPGPWRKDLVNGYESELPDGRIITPDEVLGVERPGARLVLSGDIGDPQSLLEITQGADMLVCEATYLQEEAQMAEEFGHLTAHQAAEIAQQTGVKQLVLTHISRRYREKDVLEEAQAVFSNTRVARDFDTFQVKRED
ncbi:MAG: ribonuclease Z [Chloroflexota bacterium]